jgi:hypothetical protein
MPRRCRCVAIQGSQVLADLFATDRHGVVAARLASVADATEAIMTDFASADWRVTMPRRRQMGDRA